MFSLIAHRLKSPNMLMEMRVYGAIFATVFKSFRGFASRPSTLEMVRFHQGF